MNKFLLFLGNKKSLILIFIIFLASFLRIYNLGNLPSGFHGDEASFLLNTEAIKLNGHDEDNQFLPIYLRSFIDPKPALYSYLQIPFIYILGETHNAARLPSAIFGIVSIYLVFMLIKHFTDTNTALISAFLLSISPWHIVLSRGSQEVIMSFAFSIAAIFLFIKIIHFKKISVTNVLAFSILTFLSMYSYHSAKIFLPLIFSILLMQNLLLKKTKYSTSLLLFSCIALVLGVSVLSSGFIRYNAVGIFGNSSIQLILDEKIRTATGLAPSLIIRLFENKLVDYSITVFKNYGEYFSSNFLFFIGGQPARYTTPFHGLLYIFEAPLLILGIFYGFTQQQVKKSSYFFLSWLLVAPITGALTTQEIPSITRTFVIIVPFVFFITQGIHSIYEHSHKILNRSIATFLMCAFYIFGFSYFWFHYSVLQPNYHPWSRDYGSEQLPSAVLPYMNSYNRIYISTNQYAYFGLAHLIPITEIQKSYPNRLQRESTYGKITFVNIDCYTFPAKEKTLFITKGICPEYTKKAGFNKIKTVKFKDGIQAYNLYDYLPPKLIK